jgi:PAS domain S-box-containing protein
VPRTSRKTSSPHAGPAASDAARLANQRTEESLMDHALESEERFRSIYENTIDGILLTAPDGCILAANPEACRLLGRTEQEIRGTGHAGIFDPSDPLLPAMLRDRAATGHVRGELTMIRADGTRFPIEFSSAIFTDRDGKEHTSLAFRDISQRKRAEDAVAALNRQLEAQVVAHARQVATLLKTGRGMASELRLQPLLANILSELGTAIEYTGAAVASVDSSLAGGAAGGASVAVILNYVGPASRERMVGARIALDQASGYRRVLEERTAVLVEDVWAEVGSRRSAWPVWDENIAPHMTYARSWLAIPLMAKGELVGLLQIDHRDPGRFTPGDVAWLLGFGHHVAVAIVNAWLYEASQRAAVAAERERVASELHDSVSQVLYGIGLAAHATRERLTPDLDWLAARMDHLEKLAETGLAEMRVLLLGLRPEVLVAGGLVKGLEQVAELLRGRHDLHVETRCGAEPNLSDEVKLALFRIAQEATTNAGKHAEARNVTISLASDAGRAVTLEISDDGHGFAPAESYPGRFGLKNMQERARKIGATWEIASDAASGTQVRVRLPVGERAAA